MENGIEPVNLTASLFALVGIILIIATLSSWVLWTISGTHRYKADGLPAGPHNRLLTNVSSLGTFLLGAALVAPFGTRKESSPWRTTDVPTRHPTASSP